MQARNRQLPPVKRNQPKQADKPNDNEDQTTTPEEDQATTPGDEDLVPTSDIEGYYIGGYLS